MSDDQEHPQNNFQHNNVAIRSINVTKLNQTVIGRYAELSTHPARLHITLESLPMKPHTTVDTIGISLSTLCILHCLFLPIVAASLPLFAVLAELEWIHKGFVILTLPVAFKLIVSTDRLAIQIFAAVGVTLLWMAAFVHQLHDIEGLVTVVGALCLMLAHGLRLQSMRHPH